MLFDPHKYKVILRTDKLESEPYCIRMKTSVQFYRRCGVGKGMSPLCGHAMLLSCSFFIDPMDP